MKKFSFQGIEEVFSSIPDAIKKEKFSILLPCYNEKEIILENVWNMYHFLKKWDLYFEIIVSDDGSTDSSYEILCQEFSNIPEVKSIRSPRNYGKGRALSTAYEISSGSYILFLDSDLELSIEHLPYFIKKMHETSADIVIGSKEFPESDLHYPLLRRIFSKSYTSLVNVLFNIKIQDIQTGIKLFKREALESSLPYLLVKKFAFDIELLAVSHYHSYKIVSHPIVLKFVRKTHMGRITLDIIFEMFKDTIAVFFRIQRGFWKNISVSKKNLSYAILATDKQVTFYVGDIFYLRDKNEILTIFDQLKKYDILIFLEKNQELPVFSFHSLDRIFSDSRIKGIVPLLYPKKENSDENLYYSLFGNMFFFHGDYAKYRPVCQKFVDSGQILKSKQLVFRSEYLFDLIQKNNCTIPDVIFSDNDIVYTPYFFIHHQFPDTIEKFMQTEEYRSSYTCLLKKNMKSIYYSCVLFMFLGLLSREYFLCIPIVFLEAGIHLWYIYSLGLCKGIRYLLLFDYLRIYDILFRRKRISR